MPILVVLAAVALVVGLPHGSGAASSHGSAGAAKSKAKKQKKANKKAQRKIRNGHYVGTRGDGESVDAIFCKNGAYRTNTGGGISTGKKWVARSAKFNKKGFSAIVAENKNPNKGGFSVAIVNRKGQWLYGINSFEEPSSLGKVERTNAKQECEDL